MAGFAMPMRACAKIFWRHRDDGLAPPADSAPDHQYLRFLTVYPPWQGPFSDAAPLPSII
jgi:hypothetical protein